MLSNCHFTWLNELFFWYPDFSKNGKGLFADCYLFLIFRVRCADCRRTWPCIFLRTRSARILLSQWSAHAKTVQSSSTLSAATSCRCYCKLRCCVRCQRLVPLCLANLVKSSKSRKHDLWKIEVSNLFVPRSFNFTEFFTELLLLFKCLKYVLNFKNAAPLYDLAINLSPAVLSHQICLLFSVNLMSNIVKNAWRFFYYCYKNHEYPTVCKKHFLQEIWTLSKPFERLSRVEVNLCNACDA